MLQISMDFELNVSPTRFFTSNTKSYLSKPQTVDIFHEIQAEYCKGGHVLPQD